MQEDNPQQGTSESSVEKLKISVCPTHAKDNWLTHRGYRDGHDGTATCMFCGWGTPLAGYYRVLDERIVDLRTYGRDSLSAGA